MFVPKILTLFFILPVLFTGNMIFLSCEKMEQTNIIAQTSEITIINTAKPICTLNWAVTNKLEKYNKDIILELSQIELEKTPDGVYEIWLAIDGGKKQFINTLDLYTLQSQTEKTIKQSVFEYLGAKNKVQQLTIQILFRGNIDANQIESKNAGILKIGKIKLIGF